MGLGKLVPNYLRSGSLMSGVRVGMQETDGYALHLQLSKFSGGLPDLRSVDGVENFPFVAGSLMNLETVSPGNKWGKSFHLEIVQFGSVLTANLKNITETLGCYQTGLGISALKKRVRCYCRRMDYSPDPARSDLTFPEEFFDRLQRAQRRVRGRCGNFDPPYLSSIVVGN